MEKENLGDFKLISSRKYPGKYTAHIYEHNIHKCKFIYIETEDKYNTFKVTFKTIPCSDCGESHILEHLILNGSEKYPIPNVFHELQKRSYSTTMNASTSLLHTDFYFSNINETDFINCLTVYLDCVFHPLLREKDFNKECHHLYFEDNDPEKRLMHGGVVYNEMLGKDCMCSRINLLNLQKNLVPDTPNRFVSGGDPPYIAKATIEYIREHYKKFYHPSNALFFFYGNANPETVFEKVSESIRDHPNEITEIDVNSFIQKGWEEPRTVEFEGPLGQGLDPDDSHTVTIAYNTHIRDDYLKSRTIAFIRSYLNLMKEDIYEKELIDTHLAKIVKVSSVSPYETYIYIKAVGINKDNVEKVTNLLLELTENALKNIDKDAANIVLRSFKRDILYPSSNEGARISSSIVSTSLFSSNLLQSLDIKDVLDELTEKIKDPCYLDDFVKEHILENKHRLITHMIPNAKYSENRVEKSNEELKRIKDSLTEEDIEKIIKVHKEVEQMPKNPGKLSNLLPKITKHDLKKTAFLKTPTKVVKDVAYFNVQQDGIMKIDVVARGIPINHPNFELISILYAVLNSVGAGSRSAAEFKKFVKNYMFLDTKDGPFLNRETNEVQYTHWFSSWSLEEDIDYVIEAIHDRILLPRLNSPEKVEEVVNKIIELTKESIPNSSSSYSSASSKASISRINAAEEAFSGLWGDKKVLEFLENNSIEDVIKMVEKLYKEVFLAGKYQIILHGSEESEMYIEKLQNLADELNSTPKTEFEHVDVVDNVLKVYRERGPLFINVNSTTGSSAVSFHAPLYNDENSNKYRLFSVLIKNNFLSREIRSKLGAYGSFAKYSCDGGSFTIYSYKGTRVLEILDAFKRVLETMASGKVTQQQVDDSAVKKLASVDAPKNPLSVGTEGFVNGTKLDDLQKRRDYYLNATAEDMIQIAKDLLEQVPSKAICTSTSICECPEGFFMDKL